MKTGIKSVDKGRIMEEIRKNGLSATQLKVIAIIAMTIDHIAWAFVDMFSVLGQTMHVIGRFTLPIMCFFIAEGYRKTSDLKKYIYRMATFATISFVPFFLFFGEEYGYRQNIIFDLLLALLGLAIVDSKDLKKWQKTVLFSITLIISAVFAGWPVFPMLLVLIFYYVKSFKKQFILVLACICMVEATIISIVILNNTYNFCTYQWRWYEFMYFFGFVLPLPLLRLYNGQKGKYPLSRYFFFLYYPCHFIILYAVKMLISGQERQLYFVIHVLCLICSLCLTILVIKQAPSKATIACLVLGVSCAIYTFGFILEIYTSDLAFAFAGVIMEYFGECIVFVSFLWFISIFCKRKIPRVTYGIAGIFSAIIMYLIITTQKNHIFYTDMHMDYSGQFPRISLTHGWGYYIFAAYMAILCGGSFILCLLSYVKSKGIEKRRIANVMLAIMCPWFAFILWISGITGGFEVSVLGVIGSLYLIFRAIVQYGYFDSIQMAEENALYHFREPILVVDYDMRVKYVNDSFINMFNTEKDSIISDTTILQMINGEVTQHKNKGRFFDVDCIPLEEKGFVQGHMICLRDITDHVFRLKEAEYYSHTDALTGLFNRNYFMECFIDFRKKDGLGSLLMFDLDNFKGVNDRFGHDTGDVVLITLAETLEEVSFGRHLTCRIGGDEYIMFLKNITNTDDVAKMCERLIAEFADRLESRGLKGITSISIGATRLLDVNTNANEESFTKAYKLADGALYEAKTSGKATFRIKN